MSDKLYPQTNSTGRPDVCNSGEAFDPYSAMLIKHAAQELNLTERHEKYTVLWEDRVAYDNAGQRLAEGMLWLRIDAPLVKNEDDLTEFWARVDELRRDDLARLGE